MSDQEKKLGPGFEMTGTKPVPEGTVLDGDAMGRLTKGEPPEEVLEALKDADQDTPSLDNKMVICPVCHLKDKAHSMKSRHPGACKLSRRRLKKIIKKKADK